MAEKKKAKKDGKKKEEIHEIYEIEKDGKEKVVDIKGMAEEDGVKKGQIEGENKLLRNILVGIGIILLILVISIFIAKASTHFNYKGVKFNIIKEGQLILYHTSFPVLYQGKVTPYNIFLRNDPRVLEETVPAKGTLLSIDNSVLNITQEFDCNGRQVIAIANLVNVYNAMSKTIIKDENASCDSLGRYMYIVIQPGNETSINKFGPSCYNINIKDCEILEGTERFIVGMLVKVNADLSK